MGANNNDNNNSNISPRFPPLIRVYMLAYEMLLVSVKTGAQGVSGYTYILININNLCIKAYNITTIYIYIYIYIYVFFLGILHTPESARWAQRPAWTGWWARWQRGHLMCVYIYVYTHIHTCVSPYTSTYTYM